MVYNVHNCEKLLSYLLLVGVHVKTKENERKMISLAMQKKSKELHCIFPYTTVLHYSGNASLIIILECTTHSVISRTVCLPFRRDLGRIAHVSINNPITNS